MTATKSINIQSDTEHLDKFRDHPYQDENTVDHPLYPAYPKAMYLSTLHRDKWIVELRPRLTGPIMFVGILLHTWRLRRTDAIPLLGLEESDSSYAEDLLSGRVTLRGRDIKDRIAYLFRIRKTLSALLRDEEVENEWLRETHDALNDQTPMSLLLEGSMENLLLVKEYVEAAAGR